MLHICPYTQSSKTEKTFESVASTISTHPCAHAPLGLGVLSPVMEFTISGGFSWHGRLRCVNACLGLHRNYCKCTELCAHSAQGPLFLASLCAGGLLGSEETWIFEFSLQFGLGMGSGVLPGAVLQCVMRWARGRVGCASRRSHVRDGVADAQSVAIAGRAMEARVQCFLCLWLLIFLHLTYFLNILLVSRLISMRVGSEWL